MEAEYSKTAEESAPVLWSKFFGLKLQRGQSVMEFLTEMEQTVARLTHCRLTGHFWPSTEFERNPGTRENGETPSRDVA